ncbi:MAG: hypothetical protein Q8O57_00525, partial [Kiritimatiellota bacterium]|nr:hypothetical protein [Kiritimatiellota bacterium]
MENSIPAILRPGIEEGTGFMTIGFGVKLSSDPAFAKGVAKHFTLEEVERLEPLFPEKEERFQRIKEQIDFYAERTPGEFRITLPDMQGPFNIAHSILGAEIFT